MQGIHDRLLQKTLITHSPYVAELNPESEGDKLCVHFISLFAAKTIAQTNARFPPLFDSRPQGYGA